MFEEITIFIPSKGRPEEQVTLSNLPEILHPRVKILVDEDELEEYEDQMYPVEIVGLPELVTGIGNVRQWAIENCETPYAFLLDDDMIFFKRIGETTSLEKCTEQTCIEMFQELTDWLSLEGYPVVGVSARQGNNRVEEPFKDVTRQMNFHGIDVNLFKHYGLKFNKQEVMEDFHMTLDLLSLGIPNRVMYQWCWNQKGSNEKGGCSTYRTWEMQKRNAEQLSESFPDFVTVVKKKTKTTWKGMNERYDVRVQWKKAYEQGVKNNEL